MESRLSAFGDVLHALPAPVRKSQYPWPLWTDGRPWRLRRGRHFGGTVDGMRSTLNTHAKTRDIAVAIVTRTKYDAAADECRFIHFQFFPDRRYAEGPPPELFDN